MKRTAPDVHYRRAQDAENRCDTTLFQCSVDGCKAWGDYVFEVDGKPYRSSVLCEGHVPDYAGIVEMLARRLGADGAWRPLGVRQGLLPLLGA